VETTLAPGAFYVFTKPAMTFGLGKAARRGCSAPTATLVGFLRVDGSRHGDLRALPRRPRRVHADHGRDPGRDQHHAQPRPTPTPTPR
jgi:hypothetical protein